MKIFVLKTCDTCRKAVRDLRENGQSPGVIDVYADGVSTQDIDRFLAKFGEALVNRRSTTWRGLSEAQREQSRESLLAEHPKLMKRPVIDADGTLFLGWTKEVRAALLGTDTD